MVTYSSMSMAPDQEPGDHSDQLFTANQADHTYEHGTGPRAQRPLPHAVQHVPIWKHPQHDVVGGGVVDERPFGVNKEDVRDPDLLYQPAIEGHALVAGAGKGQPLVLPVMPQVQGHGEVLRSRR